MIDASRAREGVEIGLDRLRRRACPRALWGHSGPLLGARAYLRYRRRRRRLRLIRPEPAAVVARFLLERDEEIAVPHVRLDRHRLGGAATDELGVDHPVGDEHIRQEPSVAIPLLGGELESHLVAPDGL